MSVHQDETKLLGQHQLPELPDNETPPIPPPEITDTIDGECRRTEACMFRFVFHLLMPFLSFILLFFVLVDGDSSCREKFFGMSVRSET